MEVVLDTADATPGDAFQLQSGGYQYALCDTHVGGTWTLQLQSPGGVWIDTDLEFAAVGVQSFDVPHSGGNFRFSGGMMGAKIYCTGVV